MKLAEYFSELKSAWGLVAAVATLSPLFLLPQDFYPPWPAAYGHFNVVVGVVLCIAALLVPFAWSPSAAASKRSSVLLLSLGGALLLAYLSLFGFWVEGIDQRVGDRVVVRRFLAGSEKRDPSEPGRSRAQEILRYGSSEAVWTEESIALRGLVLVLVFHGFLTCTTAGAALAATRRKRS